MSQIDDLLLLESAGQLPPEHQKDLDLLRQAGQVPPKAEGAQQQSVSDEARNIGTSVKAMLSRGKQLMIDEPAQQAQRGLENIQQGNILTGAGQMLTAPFQTIAGAGRFFTGNPARQVIKSAGGGEGMQEFAGQLAENAAQAYVAAPKAIQAGQAAMAVAPAMTTAGRFARVAQVVDRPTQIKQWLIEGDKGIDAAYNAARAVQTPVSTTEIAAALDSAVLKAGSIDEKVVQTFRQLRDSDVIGQAGSTAYGEIVKAQKKLAYMLGKYDPQTNTAIKDLKDTFTNAATKVDPALRDADKIMGHQRAADEVLRLVNNATGSTAQTKAKIQNLLNKKPWMMEQLGLDNPDRMQMMTAALDAGIRGSQAKKLLTAVGSAAILGGVSYEIWHGLKRAGSGGGE